MSPSPELPAALAERYEVRGLLGQGGFGEVLAVTDRELRRAVALKLLRADLRDPELERRFHREARVTAGIEHPHVVRVYDHGVTEGRAWIAYEEIPGGSLEEVRAPGPVAEEDLVRWGAQAAAGLAAIHRAGAVHRDVKPGNLLLREDGGDLVVCDLGIARSNREGTMITPDGLVLGTPAFMAPEVLYGEVPGPAADQFALAATLHLLATGTPVYGATGVPEILAALQGDWTPPAGSGLATLTRALARDPAARYPDLETFAHALAGRSPGGEGPGIAPTEVLPAPSTIAPAPRHAPLALAAGALALAVAALLPASGVAPPPAPPSPPASTPAPAGPAAAARLRDALTTLTRGHRDEDGTFLHPSHNHIDAAARHVLTLRFDDEFQEALEAGAAWILTHPGNPRRDPLAFELHEVLRHVLYDHIQVGRRQGHLDLPLLDPARARKLRQTFRDYDESLARLRRRVEDFLTGFAPVRTRAPELALTLEASLAAHLDLPSSRELLPRVSAFLASRGLAPSEGDLLGAHQDLIQYGRDQSPHRPAERLEGILAAAPMVAARRGVTEAPYFEGMCAAYFSLLFRRLHADPALAGDRARDAFDAILGFLEGLVEGQAPEVARIALGDCEGYQERWDPPPAFLAEPEWRPLLARMRALRDALD